MVTTILLEDLSPPGDTSVVLTLTRVPRDGQQETLHALLSKGLDLQT